MSILGIALLVLACILSCLPSLHAFRPRTFTATSRKSMLMAHSLDSTQIDGDLTPVSNTVLVKIRETLDETAGGILIPDSAKQKATEGTVVAAGPGRVHPDTARKMDMAVVVGDSVLYGKYDGAEIEYDGYKHQLIRDDDVLLTYVGKDPSLDEVKCVKDNVLVKLPERKTVTVAGLFVATDKASREDPMNRPDYGEVIKTGPGRQAGNGESMPIQCKPGDKVRFRQFAGSEVKIKGDEYLVLKCYDILATMSS